MSTPPSPFKHPIFTKIYNKLCKTEQQILDGDKSIAIVFSCVEEGVDPTDENKVACLTAIIGGADPIALAITSLFEHSLDPDQVPEASQVN